ncbi:MAG: nucleotidyltransferase family protein [Oscillospiraceae bacterium]|nr:nucleotidyltransferase family protein [Oscillospiraceae bacterium]
MTKEQALIALVGSEVCGRPAADASVLAAVDRNSLYEFAKEQDLAHLAGAALEKLGLLGTEEASQKLRKQAFGALYRCQRMERELTKICDTLSAVSVPHIPLKGSVLRGSYPESWMRTSCDIDVLVKQEDLQTAVSALEKALEYTKAGADAHEISLFSKNGVHLELHHDLIEENWRSGGEEVLQTVWQHARPACAGGCTKQMPDDLFYFYHIAHMAKHFVLGGCGIRPFLDIWVLNHRVEHDRQARLALLEQGKLLDFALAAEKLSQVWFGDAKPEEETEKMEDYLFRGGLYGGSETVTALRHTKTKGKLGYVLSRIFLPRQELQMEYRVLGKKKWLYPFCQIARWFRLLFGGKAGHWLGRLRKNAAVTSEQGQEDAGLLRELGLWEKE